MSAVRATVGAATDNSFPLCFNDIIGYTPGRGRSDAKLGMYERQGSGNLLVVFSKNTQLVEYEPRQNGKRTNRTGLTRSGMLIIEKATGKARPVTADRNPDGARVWREYKGSITLAGNPHVVDPPADISGQVEGDQGSVDDDGEEE